MRTYPGWQLARTAGNVMRQLVDLRIDSIMPATNPERLQHYPIRRYIQRFFPGAYEDYLASRQSTGRLPTAALNMTHGILTVVSLVTGLFLTIRFMRRGSTMMVALPLVIAAALLINATVTASVSGVFGHYQGRLAWLVTLYAALGGLRLMRDAPDALAAGRYVRRATS